MSSSDLRDDVDRLFACFKCGLSTPESALQEKGMNRQARRRRSSLRVEHCGLPKLGTSGSSVETEQQPGEKLASSKSMAIKFNGIKHISPVVFYGSPDGAPLKRPLRLLRLLREIHVDLKEQNDFNPREEVWATFPRQEEAIRFAKMHAQVHLFCYQDHLNGQRRFLVCTYEEFWRRYEKMDSRVRHHYEVIEEGLPCHLYFDLEYNKKDNPDRIADEMVDILVSVTFLVLSDKYSIQGSPDWVIELDSSTEEKFSRHLIIRVPQIAFKDNTHVGAFVSEICSWICSACVKDPQLGKLYIRKHTRSTDSTSQLFLDTAVYSRNRCFRLVSSSKAGKKSMLLPTRRFRCKNMSDKGIFMESLICRMDMDCKKLLVCRVDLDCKKSLLFDLEINGEHGQCSVVLGKAAVLHSAENFTGTCYTGRSPFPALDSFIEAIASIGNILGKIRCWYWFSAFGLMVYNMSRSRYCERIGREHKSNHVMYVVDFRSAIYYQKCYDHDCKGYRSPFRPLPKGVMPDRIPFSNLRQMEEYGDVLNVGFNFDKYMEESSSDNSEWITDSCKKDGGWWQEAIKYADHIESLKDIQEFCDQDEWEEDCNWWMEMTNNFISDVEENLFKDTSDLHS